jgi:predicted nucleotidyltransferase
MLSLRSKITKAVLSYFILHDHAELYVLEIARRLRLDGSNLAKKLRELEAEGILQSEERGKERYYSLNKSFPLLKEYKQIILKTSGIEGMLSALIRDVEGVQEAYLFGSYAKGQMDSASDIDLLAVGSHSTVELRKKLSEIQKTMDREINLISLSGPEYERRKKQDAFIQSLQKSKKIRLI